MNELCSLAEAVSRDPAKKTECETEAEAEF